MQDILGSNAIQNPQNGIYANAFIMAYMGLLKLFF